MKKTFIVRCPDCDNEISIETSSTGKKIDCPDCGCSFTAPDGSDPIRRRKVIFMLKTSVILLVLILLALGGWKGYNIHLARVEARKIAEETAIQKRFIEKLRRYVKKSTRNPQSLIRKVSGDYEKFFKIRGAKHVKDSLEDILNEKFIMDLPPAKTAERNLRPRLEEGIAKKFPLSETQYREKKEKEAEALYKMLKQGDKITVISPRYRTFKGTFYGYTPHNDAILVNNRTIALADLSQKTRVQIDPGSNTQAKRKFIETACNEYRQRILFFVRKSKKDWMEKHGYLCMSDGFYYSPQECLEMLRSSPVGKLQKKKQMKQSAGDELENELSPR